MPNKNESGIITRRKFLQLSSAAALGAAAGCAVNPVTGRRQLMLLSESEEIAIDRQYSPHQFSEDYGIMLDSQLNDYVRSVGLSLSSSSHRPHMPYSYQVVNAAYVNAYAFPGGSIALTRGIMLSLENEAELAALLGHEIGHVTARHTATRMTKNMLLGAVVLLGTALASQESEKAGPWVSVLGGLGAGLLLARYSRDDERQADGLGMDYSIIAGYDPKGMVGLMDVLRSLSSRSPNAIERMFSSHPMSDERYATAQKAAEEKGAELKSPKLSRERYMDNTARLRRMKNVIENIQAGDREAANENLSSARDYYLRALRSDSADYTALLKMGRIEIMREQTDEALKFCDRAKKAYENEAQAYQLAGFACIEGKKFDRAFNEFDTHERLLPGNTGTIFMKGYARENAGSREKAAYEYKRFLDLVGEGEQAEHARKRMREWGYIKNESEQNT